MTEKQTNVLNFRNGKPLLPFQVRAILMAQYVDSKEKDHSAEAFVQQLENKAIMTIATKGALLVQEGVSQLLNGAFGKVEDGQEN